jgi:2-polyprenyl-6-hydroxyphenyl methylase/3-demethylubiquinone-9 3-methyltransferase
MITSLNDHLHQRLRYATTHWSRDDDTSEALDKYLRLGSKVYNRTKLALFTELVGDVRGKRILDYGGGAGITAIPYAKAGADVLVVDAERNALRTAEFYAQREGVLDHVFTLHSETFPPALKRDRFDVVLAKDVVEHIEDDEQFLRDLSALQGPGGRLVLSTQNCRSLNYLVEGTYQRWWRGNRQWMGWDKTHVRFYTPNRLRRSLERAGYEVQQWAAVMLVPYNIISWLSLLRFDVEFPALHRLDLLLGRSFPFNRLGWNVIVSATRK